MKMEKYINHKIDDQFPPRMYSQKCEEKIV